MLLPVTWLLYYFLWLNSIPLCVSVYSFIDGHIGWFHVLAIANTSAVNTEVQVSYQIRVFFSGLLESYGNYFSFLSNLNIVFYSGCTNLHSH